MTNTMFSLSLICFSEDDSISEAFLWAHNPGRHMDKMTHRKIKKYDRYITKHSVLLRADFFLNLHIHAKQMEWENKFLLWVALSL